MEHLSLEQKVRLLTGADFWSLHPEPAVGLRRIVMSDGPAGVRGERSGRARAVGQRPVPDGSGRDVGRGADRAARATARVRVPPEGRRHPAGADQVNLHRSPFGGRHFECFSEDPLLTARIGAAYVRGLQSEGVAATVKHFVANDSETERFTLDARVDERTLRELYMLPFELILEEGPWAVMAAYNAVNGHTMTESPMLDWLRDSWDGLVMTDWGAGRHTERAGNAALDLIMPGPDGPWGEALVEAVRDGRVSEAEVDEKVRRLLRLAERVGARDASPWSDEEIAAELRSTAAAGIVLARNHGTLLPLGPLRKVAVLGPNAAVARTLGGGSATVFPSYTVSPLDGLRAALDAEVTYAPGVRAYTRLPVADVVAELRYLAGDGSELSRERREIGEFAWMGTLEGVAAIELTATVRAEQAGEYVIGCSGVGRHQLSLDGEPAFDVELELGPDADLGEALFAPPQHGVPVRLAAGQEVAVELRREIAERGFDLVTLQLNVDPPFGEDEMDRAVALAREADAAIVVVGTTPEVESEGFDRSTLALPGLQDELVRRVAIANPRTVVVVNAGAPVLMPWLEEVPAVLLAWFGGQEAGNAIADVLLGHAEPGGRLPTTWPRSEEGHPSVTPVDGVLTYDEGLAIGYRGPVEPLLPFGHGLGYTTWEYLAMDGARVRLANTGTRRGREVVQVYASRPDSAIERPPRWLAGFAVVEADAGEEVIVDVPALAARVRPLGRRLADRAGRVRARGGPERRRPATDLVVELRQLEYFAAVARHGHFTRAAEALYITQPALSQQVRRLEAELGLALLRRTSRGVELTAAGADLLVHAEKVLAEVAAARAVMDRHTGASRGVARVAATAADAARLPEALADFHADHPGVQIALRQGSAAEVIALVQRGAVDVGVLALTDEPAGVVATPLADEPLRVAVALDDELAGAVIDLERLRGRAFILAEAGTALRATVLAATQAAGFSPLPLFEVGRSADRALPRASGARDRARSRVLARAARAGGRRGGSRRPAAPPAVAAHAVGGRLTGRPAAPRAPARALARAACAGARRRASGSARRRGRA